MAGMNYAAIASGTSPRLDQRLLLCRLNTIGQLSTFVEDTEAQQALGLVAAHLVAMSVAKYCTSMQSFKVDRCLGSLGEGTTAQVWHSHYKNLDHPLVGSIAIFP